MVHVFLGLGTNLGEREANLVTARDLLMKHDVLVLGQSEVRETEPLGGLDQPKYLNQVIECSTELPPFELLQTCKMVEKEMGRPVEVPVGNVAFGLAKNKKSPEASGENVGAAIWESRIIDIDILLYGDEKIDTPLLKIPHSGIDRDFVQAGIKDIVGN